jgi:hypothetical protein
LDQDCHEMWSKELKKKKRISSDVNQVFTSGLSSNSSGGSNSGSTNNLYNQATSTIPLISSEPSINNNNNNNNSYTVFQSTNVNTSNLLNLNSSNLSNQNTNGSVQTSLLKK